MIGKLMTTAVFAMASLGANTVSAADFKVTSSDFASGKVEQAQFANGMGCTGKNISPEISWSNAPEGTKSFVVTLYDKDAPTGSGWWHWVVTNIPASATSLPSGAGNGAGQLPKGALMTPTDAGMAGYGGPCPPKGTEHDYTITVKALGIDTLPVPENATPALIGFVSNMNTLAVATISAKGSR
ncbi:YbhB/YbcL family Raf kinase inhibitor-like protein [Rhizobium herbae]|uniref:Raf kinase inhibitor-like YbhB/YbcL family protein n=1 Tax=Rhizobium herbae TaxID=508661 RepID=A0ABS4ET85_9HYPH|nr:Raf kinase inhibitor-like YbhB/YbcL family protein [Rhizobium herbae]